MPKGLYERQQLAPPSLHHAVESNNRIIGILSGTSLAEIKEQVKTLNRTKGLNIKLYGVPFKSVRIQAGNNNKKRRMFSLF